MSPKEKDIYRYIYIKYAPMLIRFAEKFVTDFSAEDIVHNVFLNLWDKQVFRLKEEELKRILFISVRNGCIDQLRKTSIEQESLDNRAIQLKLEELDYYESSDELFMRNDLLTQLMKKVNELPPRSKEIFMLSYIDGLKSAEIAEQLNISVRTVENLLYRSLLYLRKSSKDLFYFIFIFH